MLRTIFIVGMLLLSLIACNTPPGASVVSDFHAQSVSATSAPQAMEAKPNAQEPLVKGKAKPEKTVTVEPNQQDTGEPAASGASGATKVGICHHTGSETNPFVFIQVSESAVPAHQAHGDIIGVTSASACPTPSVTPGQSGGGNEEEQKVNQGNDKGNKVGHDKDQEEDKGNTGKGPKDNKGNAGKGPKDDKGNGKGQHTKDHPGRH